MGKYTKGAQKVHLLISDFSCINYGCMFNLFLWNTRLDKKPQKNSECPRCAGLSAGTEGWTCLTEIKNNACRRQPPTNFRDLCKPCPSAVETLCPCCLSLNCFKEAAGKNWPMGWKVCAWKVPRQRWHRSQNSEVKITNYFLRNTCSFILIEYPLKGQFKQRLFQPRMQKCCCSPVFMFLFNLSCAYTAATAALLLFTCRI